ncbi:DoxX family protein [Rhodococcus spongiicola]|uniref:DoxX family protein n=1 Tax=Rhodococcus spongiicola TaxID=2487352 RepID=A0A3S3BHK7_9NOCA|nr:DoxX family protein [Rhodococcus spongiicola]RVW01462.1 DoxX family protein [Rhodococcus spongiicola]
MNVVVWIVTGLLAAMFLMAGSMKLLKSKDDLVASNQSMHWAKDFPAGLFKFIGAAEVAAAFGLILPGAFGIATWLVPAAAIGLVVVMIGAAITHLRHKEYPNVVMNLVLLAAALFVAIERIGPQSF